MTLPNNYLTLHAQNTVAPVDGVTLTKTGGSNGVWDAGAASNETAGGDCSLEFICGELSTSEMLGLSATNPDASWQSLQFAFYLSQNITPNTWLIAESGSSPLTGSAYVVGDRFRIERVGTAIKYYQNDVLQYTSLTASSGAVLVDSAINSVGGSLRSVRLRRAGVPVAITWNTTNVAVTAQRATPASNVLVLGAPDTASTITNLAVQGATLAAMQAGSAAYKYVVAIEGYPYLLTDANTVQAVIAHAGTDYTQALGGLYVELDNEQKIDPWDPFQGGGRCVLRVQADSTDRFGIDTHRKAQGPETMLTATADRGAMVLKVNGGTVFSAGDAYIGTECVTISSADPTNLWLSARGKYSPFGSNGTGNARYAEHHRVLNDPNTVRMNPVVSQQPRVWVGKWVGVWMHKVDGVTGQLNSKSNAQCVFAGRITGISDDPNTGYTCVELKHGLDCLKDTTIGRDFYSANITEGLYIATGLVFSFSDWTSIAGAATNGNDLTVVASGASGTNQINAGYYSLEEICSFLNSWLGAEKKATRITGFYTWKSPDTVNAGLRTTCTWRMPNAGTTGVKWIMTMPSQVSAFLGCVDAGPGTSGASQQIGDAFISNTLKTYQSPVVPWRTAFFRLGGPGIGFNASLENERGQFVDQYALLPAAIKQGAQAGLQWGIFVLDEKYLIFGAYSAGLLNNCWITPYKMPGAQSSDALSAGGRRADETTGGPVTIRQVFLVESTFANVVRNIFYSSGVPGYNSATYDTFGYGFGLGIPGSLLGNNFDQSIDNMPGAAVSVAFLLDEPTKIGELLAGDLILRHAFPMFKNGGFQIGTWQTPLAENAVATLTESNKAEPSGHIASQRSANVLSEEWLRNAIKIDYDRDITFGKDGTYQSSITFEDQVSVDDRGGESQAFTIKARNTLKQFAQTGAGIEALLPGFMATMPMFSRASRHITRSIDLRYYEGLAPGDIVLVTDAFARDPATGIRGISSRAAIVTRIRYNPGGPQPGDPSSITPPQGEVDLFFLDLHRSSLYAPCAQVDDSKITDGFSVGWNVSTRTLQVYQHQHSFAPSRSVVQGTHTSIQLLGEAIDASRFAANDRIRIVQIDPDVPTTALSWQATILSVSGSQIAIDRDLPGWDVTKFYRVIFDNYSTCQATQQGFAFQADATTRLIENVAQPYEWSASQEPLPIDTNIATDKPEFVAAGAYGDGRAFDVGHERAIARLANSLNDSKTAHQTPLMIGTSFGSSGASFWGLNCIIPVFFGMEQTSNSIARYLTVAPSMKTTSANAVGFVRVTLSKERPVNAPGSGPTFQSVAYANTFAQQTWSTTSPSTAWTVGEDRQLNLLAKNGYGWAWLVIETFNLGLCRGLTKCIEGIRVLSP